MSADPVAPANQSQLQGQAPVPKRRSFFARWARRLLPLVVLLVLLVWFAPTIVAKTELRNRIARAATADLKGTLHVGGASFGWFSPIELTDVTITDEAGRTIATVPKVTSEKSLLALARNRADLGTFTLDGAALTVVFEKGTTNVEGALASYLNAEKPNTDSRPPVALTVTNAALALTDAETNKTTRVEGVNGSVTVPSARAEPVIVALTAATGNLKAELALGATGSAKLSADALALDTFAPALKRAHAGVALSGALTANVQLNWGAGTASAFGTVSAAPFSAAGAALKGDALALEKVSAQFNVERTGSAVRVRELNSGCDVGALSATGTFDPDAAAESVLAQSGVTVSGHVELAKLAAKLNKALAVRAGTEFREGKVELKLTSRATDTGVAWDGKVNASALKATRDGQEIKWDKPFDAEFTARHAPGQLPTFDKLVVRSDFVAANARVAPDSVQLAANVYIDRLAKELGKFVDLGGAKLDGEALAQLVARREPDGAFVATGGIELKRFAFTDGAGRGLIEPELKVTLNATGTLANDWALGLKTATVALAARGDELNVTLVEPVSNVGKLDRGTADLRLTGDLARWKARAAALARVPYQFGGTVVATGKLKFGAERATVDGLVLDATAFKFVGAGLNLDEPKLRATADLVFTRATGVAVFNKLVVEQFPPLAVKDGTLTIETRGDLVVSANGQCVADVARLGAVFGATDVAGRGTGPLRFRYSAGTTTFGGTLDVANFVYGPKEKPTWAEPAVRLDVEGEYREKDDAVALRSAAATRPGLLLKGGGSVLKLATTRDLKFEGALEYDWDKLNPLARELAGASFTGTGKGSRPVKLEGPLNAPEGVLVSLGGKAGAGWESLSAYGFDVGRTDVTAKLAKGALAFDPINTSAGGGTLLLAPTIYLDKNPPFATLPKGPILVKVKLTTQSAGGAIKFALPAIAGSARADGSFDAGVNENAKLVLGAPAQSTASGLIVIHKATLAPGPVIAEVATLLGAQNTTMTLANGTVVPFQVEKGRVYHQNFPIKLGGTTIRTSGSVGFDESLELVVEVPLPNDLPLLKNHPILMKAAAGKPVKVPLKGTLTKPLIDVKAFNEAVIVAARSNVKGVGKELFDKELNKLFQKK
jgi:hypothetical protein